MDVNIGETSDLGLEVSEYSVLGDAALYANHSFEIKVWLLQDMYVLRRCKYL